MFPTHRPRFAFAAATLVVASLAAASCDTRTEVILSPTGEAPDDPDPTTTTSGGGGMAGMGFTPSSGQGGATTGGNQGQGGNCGSVAITIEPEVPTVLLLIDQSGSMTADFNNQGTRWDVVYEALMDPQDGVVTSLEGLVRFGLALYTWNSGTCPNLVEVNPPATNNRLAIDAIYANELPDDNTPTGDSIDAVTPGLVAFNEPGPKLMILATDGNPDRCEAPAGHDQISMDEATAATQAAYAQGIETVIIAVGDQVSDKHQQDMANAGTGRPVPAPFPCDPMLDPQNCARTYEPTTKQALVDALFEIILGQRSCTYSLDGAVIPGKECEGTVTVNGQTIPCNDPDGWVLNTPTEIAFVGATCDVILSDPNVAIDAEWPCDAIQEAPK